MKKDRITYGGMKYHITEKEAEEQNFSIIIL